VTGREFAKKDSYPAKAASDLAREPWIAKRDAAVYGIVLDAQGKIAWGRSDIGGDPIVVVLTEQVRTAHLDALREDGVSYLFAGKRELDLALLLEIPEPRARHQAPAARRRRPRQRSFLRAGLVDEISLAIVPAVDGPRRAACVRFRVELAARPRRSRTWS